MVGYGSLYIKGGGQKSSENSFIATRKNVSKKKNEKSCIP